MTLLAYTTEDLIDSVRLRGRIPNIRSLGLLDADIVRVLNEEMRTKLLPAIQKPQEEHLTKSYKITLVSGTSRYRVPSRSAGLRIRNLLYVDGTTRTPLQSIPRGAAWEKGSSGTVPTGFYFEGPWIVLVPDIGSTFTGELELSFFMRPGDLVQSSEYFKVTTVSSTTEIIVDGSPPASWLGTDRYDIHSSESGGEIKVWDRTVASIVGNTITFSTAIDGSVFGDVPVQIGDYFVKAGTAAIPGLPIELHAPLAVTSAAALLRPLDFELSELLKQDFNEMMVGLGYTIDKRADHSPPKAGVKRNPVYD